MVLEEYVTERGDSPFGTWFDSLHPVAAAKVTVALTRIERGAVSNVKGVGEGVLEFRIDAGPGYRIDFGLDGAALVILLTGGTKRRQAQDIETAKAHWRSYRSRKRAASEIKGRS